ncbi:MULTISPECIES: hypothetical protein [Sinorhizobium]|uniref:hypothetical protein n=1 Tax=Sinorhizobium TaxID=28105 RepID=UPI0011D2484E|nr:MULTISPECIES: hypothetical protein [Sinorhizobium]WOS66918.1 hypothetical protein SFGR64A_31390 [Sinorhizobium fredii GR64]
MSPSFVGRSLTAPEQNNTRSARSSNVSDTKVYAIHPGVGVSHEHRRAKPIISTLTLMRAFLGWLRDRLTGMKVVFSAGRENRQTRTDLVLKSQRTEENYG